MSRYKLEVMLSEELLAKVDAARVHEPRASFARRAIEAAVAGSEAAEVAVRAPLTRTTSEPPVVPRRRVPDPPAEVALPKIAKRKW